MAEARPPMFTLRKTTFCAAAVLFTLSLTIWTIWNHSFLEASFPFTPTSVRNNASRPRIGAVSSESALCTDVGIDLLRKGGSAADAMVGAVLCVGVVAMYHSGPGGGGFALVRTSQGSFDYIDFRETAPAAAAEDMYRYDVNASIVGGKSSGIPGELRGLELLHKAHGRLPWSEVVYPSSLIARNGFRVTADLVKAMNNTIFPGNDFFIKDPVWAQVFAPNGELVKEGDTMKRIRYAEMLDAIARGGADAFYNGPIADALVIASQSAQGIVTAQDLASYTALTRKPLSTTYRGFNLTAAPSPAAGAVALSALKIFEGYPGLTYNATVNQSTHRLDEALRFAYGQRTILGDPSFVPDVEQFENAMISEETTSKIRSMISDHHTLNQSAYNPDNYRVVPSHGTAHITTVDGTGLAISLTSTINHVWGSRIMVPSTGVILNNEMGDFSIPNISNSFGYQPSPANFIRPGKRPLSSIVPLIAEFRDNGTLYLALGAAGGSHIISAIVQAAVMALDAGLSTAQTLSQPRFHDQLQPNQVDFEWAYDNRTVAFMQARGHNVTWTHPGTSFIAAVRQLPNGTLEAASDPNWESGGATAI